MKKPNGYWDVFENVEREAKKYKSRTECARNSSGAYDAARRHGWLDILFPVKNVA